MYYIYNIIYIYIIYIYPMYGNRHVIVKIFLGLVIGLLILIATRHPPSNKKVGIHSYPKFFGGGVS